MSELLRPRPVLHHRASPIDRNASAVRAARRLCDGETLLVSDSYSTGAEILAQLENQIRRPPPTADYSERQAYKRRFREAARNLLAPITDHKLALAGARPIGFLAELYPELDDFELPFIEVQELHSAWQRYEQGVHMAVLGHRLHPFFGTYAPTRSSHLELFGTWLHGYQGARGLAVDVGTGCGVLALMLAKAGFERVLATDDNPNAVESLRRELARQERPGVEARVADLLGGEPGPVDLIVFNPPWVRGEVEGLLDRALIFDEELFERFFAQATEVLAPEGRVVLVFSNVMQLLRPDLPNPIEQELERGRFELAQKLRRKVKARGGRRTREKVEIWELALV